MSEPQTNPEPEVKRCFACNEAATTSIHYGDEYYPSCQYHADRHNINAMVDAIRPSVKKLIEHVNGRSGRDTANAFIEIVLSEHRTLQQSFFGTFIIPLILKYASLGEGWYDMRNEATVEACRKMASAIKDSPYLPFY